jgi:hypothetical protein
MSSVNLLNNHIIKNIKLKTIIIFEKIMIVLSSKKNNPLIKKVGLEFFCKKTLKSLELSDESKYINK